MSGLENLLREVLAELATEAPAPAPDRAETALRTTRTRRRTAVLVTAAAVALVVAGALLVPNALDRASGPVPAGTLPPGPTRTVPPAEPLPALPVVTALRLTEAARTGPYQVTSYVLRSGATAVRVPGSTTFRTLPWTSVSVSPTGRIAVVDTIDATPGHRIGIIDDLAAGRIRWVDTAGPVLNPAWSPDGRRVLVTGFERDAGETGDRLGAQILDTTTWTVQRGRFAPPDPSSLGSFGLHLGWDPGGDSIVGAVDLPYDYTDDPKFALRWWSLDGAESRTVPTPGVSVAFGTQLLSPSGRRAAVAAGPRDLAIVDTRTGRTLTTVQQPSQTVFGWSDEDHLAVEGSRGPELLALDGSVAPYATRSGAEAIRGRIDITPVTP